HPATAPGGAPLAPPGQCRPPERLPGPQLAHCSNPTSNHHPQPPSAPPVLGRGPTAAPTPKYLAGNLGKLSAVKFLLLNAHRFLLLNSRRQCFIFRLYFH